MKTKLISVLIIVAVVLGGIAGYISFRNKNGQKENPPTQGHDLRATSFAFSFDDPNYFANAPQYKFPLDLSEVSDYEKIEYYFSLTQEQSEFLKNKGFVGLRVNWDYDDFALAYRSLKKSRVPIFITTDSMFHTYHIFFDDTLRSIEEQYLFNYTKDMTIAMLEKSKEQYEFMSGDIKEAARKNVAYFSVALRLLDPEVEVADYVVEEVDEELSLIKEHKGYAKSPIFDKSDIDFKLKYLEDYSQYKPRGHYTRSEMLKKYFKGMMWYGRMMFRAKSDEETIGAIIIADGMKTAEDGKAAELWKKIYEVTVFFVGLADDLIYEEYINTTVEVFGTLSSDYNELNDAGKLSQFKEKLKQIRLPKICSSFVTDQQNMTEETLGLRFMGQRFIPDSYMFQELVYDKVFFYEGDKDPFTLVSTIAGPIRGFPRGLDVLAVLGSDEAEKILDSEGDTEYDNYDRQLLKLKEEFFILEESIWTQNLYWGWLYTEKSLSMDLEEHIHENQRMEA